MKKLILFLFMLIIAPVQSAQIANVEYIHTAIADKWDITIPYNREITNVGVAANMKYLLTAVDVANEILNGEKTTDYGKGEFATMVAADTVATDTAVETLVKKEEKYKFRATVACDWSDSCIFKFVLSAAGMFSVDWGDGTVETIERTNTTEQTYSHDYMPGEYTFKFNGLATDYDEGLYDAPSTFAFATPDSINSPAMIRKISGCMGCIFPTLGNGKQPKFQSLFRGQTNLTGEIPANFFAGIRGSVRKDMFTLTFDRTGFSRIGVPLFDDLSAELSVGAFHRTFSFMPNISGSSATMRLSDGSIKYLYEVYPDATYSQVGACYYGSSGFDDYANIPHNWTYWDI